MSDVRFEAFVNRACYSCVNSREDCQLFDEPRPKCHWADEFLEAKKLCTKLDDLEGYYQHLAEITPDDEYDLQAEENALKSVQDELDELERSISRANQDNWFDYPTYYAYDFAYKNAECF